MAAVDELTTQLSQTRIAPTPSSAERQSCTSSITQHNNAVDQVIYGVLKPDLKASESKKLLPDHPCFDVARKYAKKWNISAKAVDSHIKLACGYLKFPVIMLLNPAPKHEYLAFDEMVQGCKTLRWIEDVLHRVGLGLADVIILDACTLLSNDRIRQIEREGGMKKEQALSEAYDVTEKALQAIKPNIILSCQCSTTFPEWRVVGHVIAEELSSSIKRAGEVRNVEINNQMIDVIQAYHPGSFLNRKGHHDPSGQKLKELFRRLYLPCATWKSQNMMALFASVNKTIFDSTSTLVTEIEDKKESLNIAEDRLV